MNINECILHNLRKLRKNRFMYKIIVHDNVSDTVFVFTCILKTIHEKALLDDFEARSVYGIKYIRGKIRTTAGDW